MHTTRSGTGTVAPARRSQLFRLKPVDAIVAQHEEDGGHGLRRSMSLWQLTALSIGATLGTGIFVILGEAVPLAGPAVVLGFVLAAVTALFSALSYAELAGSIPVSGSSYSYTYATMGELVAWVCGWCLMLEYGVSVAAVAVGWGAYIDDLASNTVGAVLPAALSAPPGDGGVVNVPAIVVVLLAMALLLRGTSESARVNAAMVVLKVGVLLFFCVVAFTAFRAGNLAPFVPMGIAGVTAAASQAFFSYIGFDAASTAGDEARDARRDLPRAIILSLLVVTVVYCLVALSAVGAVPWQQISGSEAALADVLSLATGQTWTAVLLSIGAVIAIASVVLTVLYGQTRILYAMSRDGLVPPVFSRVSARRRIPVANTVIVSVLIALLAGLVPLGELANATSIGTLFAFALVNVGVVILRRTRPDLPRSFRTPLYPVTPVLGVLCCVLLVFGLGTSTWVVFVGWMLLGLAVYLGYGYRRSALRTGV
ncbi:amino acid/polyamine/organocation transporter, APC superfamily [Geodermatophilus dictyosporus]|uniref:Amino acid/polyamine/organocation transporter, APC superfamily n=1 Tax=Geodermatophilus dictyosporus TaxID=1523247 RepID=A0A1I5T6J6_9ACTN|nr:amino acid permease [Geodermatophilus dictyosporus]SFP78588.1 amino acid/polyamine/organocation transporter, APC superfamily [Geodermatophilus dictyosporus]